MGASIRGGRRRRKRAPMAEINVTPFVDVMLVLLIIFMVAAPLLVTGVPVDLPKTAAKALNPEADPITISVDRAGRVFMGSDGGEVAAAALPARLLALRQAQGAEARVFLRADAGVPYGAVAAVLAQATGAGFTRVALINQPTTEPTGGANGEPRGEPPPA